MTTNAPLPQAASLTVEQALQKAIAWHQAGQLQDAERLYRAILQAQPNHPDANHNLGVLAVQAKQPASGLTYFKAAVEAGPNQGQYWLSYIDALIQAGQTEAAREVLEQGRLRGLAGEMMEALALMLGDQSGSEPSPEAIDALVSLFNERRYKEAASLAQTMTMRFPLYGFGWKVLGAALQEMGRTEDALVPMERAAALSPGDADAHSNLGVTLHNLGRLKEAEASYRRALQMKPDYAEAHNNLGNTLHDLGQLEEAEASFRRALQIKPDYAEAHYNLGNSLQDVGRLDAAEASYRRALQLQPKYADALKNLALLLYAQDKSVMALSVIRQSLQIKETREAKGIFVACVKHLRWTHYDSDIQAALVRALTEPWGRPSDLVRISEFVKLAPNIGECVVRAADAWPLRLSAEDLFGSNGLNALAASPLLCALLGSTPISDVGMERFLTMARHAMLEIAAGMTVADGEGGGGLSFYSALARQCFINEYVWSFTDDELEKANDLRDSLVAALKIKARVPVLWPVAVAAYFPLCSLPSAARLLDTEWPEAVTAVLVQQVREPEEEIQERANIARLTDIEDAVSLLVQRQYEENPYPRWVKVAPAGKSENIVGYLSRRFPLASFNRQDKTGCIDILVAGCGTGEHPIETAQRFQGARVLAVDLSTGSLGYAKRKTRELGLTSIEYAQADILKLGSVGRSFDVIESVGVLHHLADPLAGWRVLLSLLRPNGFMKLGFYSEVARRNIIKARAFIANQGYGVTANEIRRCRQELVDLGKSTGLGIATRSTDFFSISTCRDLLFHVQEHRMTLSGIEAFLREDNLAFLGFEIAPHKLRAYRLRFPDDRAATNLGHWQTFEQENPDTFFGMYQFWIQKAGQV